MNRYNRYQNVNSYWYDEVPEHWKKTKNKYVFHQDKKVVGSSWEDYVLLTMGKSGVKPRDMEGGGKFPASFENYQVVSPNQIIFCLFDLDETPRTVGKSSDHGMITSAYDVFSTTPENVSQFWTYFYQMIDDHKGLRPYYTGLRKVVRSETFMGIEVFSPPIEEQKLISRYLDKKTSQIDSLVEKIQNKIELLKEQRTSLINHYVTKGLDPNVEMKDSGVEWIGEIPKHWEVTRLKYHGEVLIGLSFDKEDMVDEGQGTLVLRSSNVQNGQVNFSDNVWVKTDVPEKLFVQEGDILICSRNGSRNLIGKNCLLGEESLGMTWGVFMSVFRSKYSEFFFWILNSQVFTSQSGLFLTSTINQLTVSTLENLVFPFVSDTNEQNKINDLLRKETKSIDELIEKEQRRISLLKEYRQSIISSAVTGKVRISEDMI